MAELCTNNSCPAYDKCTAPYRGSRCAAMRDSYGLGDPKTNFDAIRAMNVEELANMFTTEYDGGRTFYCPVITQETEGQCAATLDCAECFLDWLKSPAEVDE